MLLKWVLQCFTKAIYVGAQKLFMIINIMVINNNDKKKTQRTNNDIVHLSKWLS